MAKRSSGSAVARAQKAVLKAAMRWHASVRYQYAYADLVLHACERLYKLQRARAAARKPGRRAATPKEAR